MERDRGFIDRLNRPMRIALITAGIALSGGAIVEGGNQLYTQQERDIDARCGGPSRSNCVTAETRCYLVSRGFGTGEICGGGGFLTKTPTPELTPTSTPVGRRVNK